MADSRAPVLANSTAYNVEAVRRDFPILSETVYGKPLVFLDSGASAQKPRQVIEAMRDCMEHQYSNVHRGAHYMSAATTDAFETARERVQKFLNAGSPDEIVFTANVTAAINLVANSFGRAFLREGDEVIVSEMEHHANIVPWQMLAEATGVKLVVAPVEDDGSFRLERFAELLTDRTRFVAITHCSNVLGTRVPAKELVQLAHDAGAKVLLDGAQAAVHGPVDVRDLDADFYGFTAHKLYGPTGLGVLYGKLDLLNAMPPWQGGGEMIEKVSFKGTTYKEAPHRFEAGTPAIVEAIGLGAAIGYVEELGRDAIAAHEQGLLNYANERLRSIDGVRLIGTAADKAAIVSFLVDGIHPYDVAAVLDRQGVACRVGHHCAEPLMDRLGVIGTVRASFGLYNTLAEVDALAEGIEKAKRMLG
ncbi:aminotransferase class V-fold PLP-dependent enzyme [Minwuia thermotolerans]|uniref:cysteine desulfurase n=1 Tax=Minwuia thermotolerans TaxID=2056226 RepID=A0A2M9G7J9_9PROT|nr:cysteine desulfurase [Minwuia thermotolerans]PJK31673.1 cysteine desulfurase [Minwuia thermotolerans]